MWIIVMFDLPVDTKQARKRYRLFREFLLQDGFWMLQYSVYARYSSSQENTDVHIERVKDAVPSDGHVRILTFTDKQFARMKVYYGKLRGPTERGAEQISFF